MRGCHDFKRSRSVPFSGNNNYETYPGRVDHLLCCCCGRRHHRWQSSWPQYFIRPLPVHAPGPSPLPVQGPGPRMNHGPRASTLLCSFVQVPWPSRSLCRAPPSPRHAQTWSNFFNLDLTVLDMLKPVHYEAWTVGKWVVGIRLKSLFVKLNFITM